MTDLSQLQNLMQVYPPIDLYDEKLRALAKELGPAWVRVSGTWASKTYYDFDGSAGGQAPEGYQNVMSKEQWIGVLDFVKAIDAAEFMNEPNMLTVSGGPEGYTAADYARDQDLFFAWVREHYPGTLPVGPCNTEGAGHDRVSGGMIPFNGPVFVRTDSTNVPAADVRRRGFFRTLFNEKLIIYFLY